MTTFSTIESIEQAWGQRKASLNGESRQTAERRERLLRAALRDGIPTTRHEEWKYTSLRPLVEQKYQLLTPSSTQDADVKVGALIKSKIISGALPLVFVDGQLDVQHSSVSALAALGFRKFSEAESAQDATWWDFWQTSPGMTGLFAGINAGFVSDGAVLELKKGQDVERPLHILHVVTNESAARSSMTRILIAVPEASRLRVYEDFVALNESMTGWSNALTQFKLGPLADCGYYRVVSSPGVFHTGTVSAVMDRGTRFETCSLVAGSRLSRINFDVKYTAPDAECILNGLYLTRGHEHVDHHTAVDHQVGFCRTHQLYKGILNDESRAVFNGKIFIRKDAQKTEAYQTTKNLLLSPKAEVDAKPQLEIDADDVKASHGAAIGSIDPLELFYLQSRCIGRAEAMAMLCRGFADDVVMRLKDESARQVLTNHINEWFKQEVSRSGGAT